MKTIIIDGQEYDLVPRETTEPEKPEGGSCKVCNTYYNSNMRLSEHQEKCIAISQSSRHKFSDKILKEPAFEVEKTISITSEDGTIYEFYTHGYDLKFFFIDEDIHGAIKIDGSWYSCEWSKLTGNSLRCTYDEYEDNDYNLTPIKKEWYEKQFDMVLVVVDEKEMMLATEYSYDCFTVRPLKDTSDYDYVLRDKVRPATKEEILSLHYSNSKSL